MRSQNTPVLLGRCFSLVFDLEGIGQKLRGLCSNNVQTSAPQAPRGLQVGWSSLDYLVIDKGHTCAEEIV